MYHLGILLSSCIFSKMLRKGSAEYITNTLVHNEQSEGLADYVRRIMSETRFSYRDIEENALKKGHFISNGYVSKIVSGAAQNISVDKLRALAAGLNRPEEEVFAVARGGRTEEKIKDALASAMFWLAIGAMLCLLVYLLSRSQNIQIGSSAGLIEVQLNRISYNEAIQFIEEVEEAIRYRALEKAQPQRVELF